MMQKGDGTTTFPGILWGMLWRATVLFPVAMIAGVAALFSWAGVVIFPILAALYAYTEDWTMAGLHLALGVASILLWLTPAGRRLLD